MDTNFLIGFGVGVIFSLFISVVLFKLLLRAKTEDATLKTQQSLDIVLNPVKERIKDYQLAIEEFNQSSTVNSTMLKSQLDFVVKATSKVENEAHNLTKALKGDVKIQGSWGEFILDRVFELSGLTEGRDYILQGIGLNLTSDDGRRLMPDAIINLPDDSQVIVDSKVSLLAYEKYISSGDSENIKEIYQSLKSHIDGLSSKNYEKSLNGKSPQFVVLFMPIDRILHIVSTYKQDIIEYAWSKNVMLAGPSNLMPILKTIGSLWTVTDQNQNAKIIAQKAGLFIDKFSLLYDELLKMQQDFSKVSESFDKSLNRLNTGKGNLLDKAGELKELGVSSSKSI